jgi:hypothetical protein
MHQLFVSKMLATVRSKKQKVGCRRRGQPKRKGRELDGGILTHPEMAGVSEHYFRLARQHLIRWGFLAIARPSDRAFKSKRVSHHAPSGWRCPATLYKIGANFAPSINRERRATWDKS